MTAQPKRRPNFTAEEAQQYLADREKNSEMSTKEWCAKNKLTENQFYALRARFGSKKPAKPGKTVKDVKAWARKQPGAVPVMSQETAELVVAVKEWKRWRLEVDRLSAGLTTDQLRALVFQLIEQA